MMRSMGILKLVLIFDNELSLKNICELSGMSESDTLEKIGKLIKHKFVFVSKNVYRSTIQGRDFYANNLQNKNTDKIDDWKNEVLTGTDKKGKETKIQNAVLPKFKRPGSKTDAEIEMINNQTVYNLWNYAARELGLSVRDLKRLDKDGRVKICNGHSGTQHVGIFDKKKRGLQYLCKKCLKTKREEGQ